ncbi:leucine-rich repeat domain-containing protein [Sebaldella sp. S0638]|uniref:leucine-rich repeat domain-containing protein n=1 Tax=Sebaldella sp. S0638 TaxID=2957809 RepID=UPI00209D7590|nr:hypothetical protein [Sebaldella sp. S0638]MCP1226595.1 hypothetical protein [Sebaldella sp. S0638]
MKRYKSYYLPGEFINEDRTGEGFICVTEDYIIEGNLDLNPELDAGGMSEYLEKLNCPYGFIIAEIYEMEINGKLVGNPLEAAGVKIGSTVISVNGKLVRNIEELDKELESIRKSELQTFKIEYIQDKEVKTTDFPVYYNQDDERAKLGIDVIFMEVISGLYFTKNLEVTESIVNKNSNYGIILQVRGNVKAKNIIAGGADFIIEGNADIEDTVLGFYNDGEFRVDGDLTCRTFMNYDHHMDCAPAAEDSVGDYGDYEFDEYLLPEYRGNFDKLTDAVAKGREYRNPDRKSNFDISMSEIYNRLSEDPKKLDISNCEFDKLPDIIYGQTQLESLKVGRVEISPRIAELVNLKELDIKRSFSLVPESLHTLPSLEKLTVGIASQEDFHNICKILSLKELQVEGSYQLFGRFDEKILKLKNLESLTVKNCAEPTAYEKAGKKNKDDKEKALRIISKMTELRKLDLSYNYLYTLTDDFVNLKNLEFLRLSGNPTLQNLPDFSQLEKLRELYFSGESSYSNVPPAKPELLKQILSTNMPLLETLYAERWKIGGNDEMPDPHKNMPNLKTFKK